jgi:DNA-binding LacI/PurR family transcriptional regulator
MKNIIMSTLMPRQVTLQVLADQLGCSAKTVSNAFNRPDQLSAATRERVLAAAARMGYAGPNPLAAGLRRGRVGALGFAYANNLAYAFEDPVSVALLAGITSVVESAGTGLLLVPGSATADRNAAAVSDAVIDGLVICSLADDDPLLDAALARRVPTVVIDQPDPERLRARGRAAAAWIGIDDRAAACVAAEHLLALGHREVGVVTFGLSRRPTRGIADERTQAEATYAVTRHRLQGYREAAIRAGLDWAGITVAAGTDSTVAEGAAATATLLDRTPAPTAILCLSDRLAEGAIQEARDRGLRIPDELSIVGFDDAEPAARLGLTTIRQPNRDKGERAARALLALIDGRGVEAAELLPTELVVRSSTQPPSGRR